MSDCCLEPIELARALGAPPDDPRRQHLQTCPHCRALVHALREFQDPTLSTEADALDAADAELALRLSRRPEWSSAQRPTLHPRPVRVRQTFRRPLYALAAGLALCACLYAAKDIALLRDRRLPTGEGAMRGDAPQASDPIWTVSEGASQVSWRFPPEATEAVVVVYDRGMQELARLPAGRATSLPIAPGAWPAPAAFAQVLFLADGDTLARSHIVTPR